MHGYQVDCALNREAAEAFLAKGDYEVVIEDLRLGGFQSAEGLEIVEYVRKRYPETRIIVLTAYGSSEMEAEARSRGADAFMRKPKPLREVAQVVFGLVGTPA